MNAHRALPDTRQALTHKFSIAGHEGYITVGHYEDGAPGEIFLVMAKEGTTIGGLMDAFATSVSLALQHGVPLAVLVKKFSGMRFEPEGFTKTAEIPYAKSIVDYIFRWLETKYLSPPPVKEEKPAPPSRVDSSGNQPSPPCDQCGATTVMEEGILRCSNCGSQSGPRSR